MARNYKHELEFLTEDDFGRQLWVYVEFNDVEEYTITNADYLENYFDTSDSEFLYSIEEAIAEELQQLPAHEACLNYDLIKD